MFRYESLEQAPPTPSPPAPPTPLQHIPSEMPLPYMYENFPELLQPVGSVSDEVLEATRAMRWQEREKRILDDVKVLVAEREGVEESEGRDGGRSKYLPCPPGSVH